MAKEKTVKTNAMRMLDKLKIPYDVLTVDIPEFVDGVQMAKLEGVPVQESFKTLVLQGKSREYYVFVLPVEKEIDLKRAALAVGEKSVEMIHVKDITKITGYVRGGCSPLGMKKKFRTVIAAELMISSGQRKRKLPILRFKVVPHVLDSEDVCIYNLLSET